jgi:hypothetical protein
MMKFAYWCVLAWCVLPIGCGAGPMRDVGRGEEPGKKPALPPGFKSDCDSARPPLKPLVVDWEAPDRAALESQAKRGALVVRYTGCSLEVLRQCRAPQQFKYGYTAITPKNEEVKMRSSDELHASIPLNAAKFEAKLAQAGELNAAMKIVGEYGFALAPPAVDQLEGDCEGASHVVTALTVGAFEFFAGSSRDASAGAQVFSAGAGGASKRGQETLSRDGEMPACGSGHSSDAAPPERCGALLRLELTKLLPRGEGVPDCKPGTQLVGKECKPVEKPEQLALEDQSFVDEQQGAGWGNRCYTHFKVRALAQARAACKKGLELNPEPSVKAQILYNYALVEDASGDPVSACELLRSSYALRQSGAVMKKIEALGCNRAPTGS